jgi:membrane protease YdiL (CAAX protease family)
VKAILFFGGDVEAQRAGAESELRSLAEGFAASDWILLCGAVFLVCLWFGAVVYAVFRYAVSRRRPGPASNSIAESSAGLLLFLLLGQACSLSLGLLGVESMAVRLGVTVAVQGVCVAWLGVLGARRLDGRGFPWWDLGPGGVLRVALVTPLAFLAFVPVHLGVTLLWRLALLSAEVEAPLQEVLEKPLTEGGDLLLLVFVNAVTVIPFLEEILFRGALFRALRTRVPFLPAALCSGFLFSACHFNLAGLIPILALAVFLAYAYERTGSLWAPIFLHALFNLVNLGVA